MIKQFNKVFGCLSLVLFSNIFCIAQNNINAFNEGIHIYPQEAIDQIEQSKYDLVVDYNGREEIFSDDNKRLVLDIDGNIFDLKNKNVTSKVKYSLQTSTFSRIPSAVSAKGYFAIKPDELKMIASANNIVVREVGLLRNYNYELGEDVIDDFSNFVANIDWSKTTEGTTTEGTSTEGTSTEGTTTEGTSTEGTTTEGTTTSETPTFSLDKLGINVSDLPSSGKAIYKVESGVLVKKVDKYSKAELSGLQAGSVISHVNGRKISSKEFLELYLQGKKGNKINFTVQTLTGETKFILINLN